MADMSEDSLDDSSDFAEPSLPVTTKPLSEEISLSESDSSGEEDVNHRGRVQSTSEPYHAAKRKKLQKHYKDQYLALLSATYDEDLHHYEDSTFEESRIGVVNWTAQEKEKFFDALGRFGRHDLPRIADAIQSKSEIEVKDYINCLRDAHIDRQIFEKQTKNVSHADIPAATEIGEACETVLNNAADAMLAYQEEYDTEVGFRAVGRSWLVDRDLAAKFDAQSAENEDSLNSRNIMDTFDEPEKPEMFNLSTCLDLSEKFFMNKPLTIAHDHWLELAEKGQRPAMTREAVDDMHDLVVSLTQRILQVAIFLAKARIRANTRPAKQPAQVLVASDIESALDVLNMKHSCWDFWTYLARRNGLQVVSGSHSVGMSANAPVPLEDAEELLSIRHSRGRRRSMSTDTGRSSSVVSEISEESGMERAVSGSEGIAVQHDDSSNEQYDSSQDYGSDTSEPNQSARPSTSDNMTSSMPLSRIAKIQLLEDRQDEYMEYLDQKARLREEFELLESLGQAVDAPVKQEYENDESIVPKTLRKSKEEAQGWMCQYEAEWERFGEIVPSEKFLNIGYDRKRKAEDDLQRT